MRQKTSWKNSGNRCRILSRGRGILFVISGPSGVGKGTVLSRVCEDMKDISVNVSVTTRKPRAGEIDGVHYNFITKERFRELVDGDGMYEYVEALGCGYGTPKQAVDEKLARSEDVILEIETQGAEKIRSTRECVSIFIVPPSTKELKRRLEERKTETAEQIEGRMKKCIQELPCAYDYDYVVLNDDLDSCVRKVDAIIEAERQKVARNVKNIDKIIFG